MNTVDDINSIIIKINNMSNSYNKDLLIGKIKSYLAFMYYTGNLNDFDYRLLSNKIIDNKRQDKIDRFEKNRINNFLKNNNNLFSIYLEILNKYMKYNLDYTDDYCDYKDISLSTISFMKYLNIYDLFKHILNNKMIGKSNIIKEANLTLNNYDDSYIVIGNFNKNNLMYYDVFIHEMGHVYVNNILKDKKLYNPISLYKEVIPITFERIFIDYLKENNLINSHDLNRLIINEETMRLVELMYTINTCEIISKNSFILSGTKVITDNIDFEYDLDYHYYAIANIISIYLLNLYKNDKEYFINNLDIIINELSSLTIKEIYNKYYNLDLINNYLKSNLSNLKTKIKK